MASFVHAQVNFHATSRGRVVAFEETEVFDLEVDLHDQAEAAAVDFIDRRRRIFGTEIGAPVVLSVFFRDNNNFWHVVERESLTTRLKWPAFV